ncbi:MAG: hypothetical protein PVI78_10480 [Anaerolineales bacterium]
MRLTPPKNASWVLAFMVGLLGIVAHYVEIPIVSEYDFWLVVAGFGLLVLATLFRGL